MSEPRKHHYVPVFYQKNFANSRGLLWVYDRKLRTHKELHPRSICFQKDLYTLKRENAPWERRVESVCMSLVDGIGASTIRDLLSGQANGETYGTLAYFIGVQFNRLPSIGRFMSAIYVRGASEVMRVMAANVGRMQSVLDRYSRETGKSINVSAESMVDAVQSKSIQVVATEVPFLQNIFHAAENLSKVIQRLDWQILVAPPQTGFIICDSPVVVVPPRDTKDVGFLVPGTVKYFPLTYRYCLRLGELGRSFGYRKVSKDKVRVINFNIAANSERFVMGPQKAQLVSIISKSESVEEDASPRFTVDAMEQDEDGSLQKITFQPRRYFYDEGPQAP
jgi:hypothetical protein